MNVARLNSHSIAIFSGWLDALKAGASTQAPLALLSDPQAIDPIAVPVEVEDRTFGSRFEAAEYLYERFTVAGLTEVGNDAGLWSWLSLFYFDCVCPVGKSGARKPGERARHVPDPTNFQRYYRHLLAGPWRIYRAHRDDPRRAMSLLCQPLHAPGDVVEQLVSRQEIVTNPGIVQLATTLYVDAETQRIKSGAGGKSGGSARRLSDVIEHFDLTWDLYSATGPELLALMPAEFDRFRVAA